MALDPQLQTKIGGLQTEHSALVQAVRGYTGGSIARTANDALAQYRDTQKAHTGADDVILKQIYGDKGGPSLLLDFAHQNYRVNDEAKTFDEAMEFTRSTPKWVFGPDGKLMEVPVDQPAIEYDPVTGECLGVLIEEERTNLLSDSEFDAYWISAAGGGAGPATLNVVPSTVHDGNMLHVVGDSPIYGAKTKNWNVNRSTEYAFSLVIMPGNNPPSTVVFRIENDTVGWDSSMRIRLDFTSGVIDYANGCKALKLNNGGILVKSIPGGNITDSSGFGTNFQVNTEVGKDESGTDFYIAMPQVEEGSFPTSYIPTSGASVTRGEDKLYTPTANSDEGETVFITHFVKEGSDVTGWERLFGDSGSAGNGAYSYGIWRTQASVRATWGNPSTVSIFTAAMDSALLTPGMHRIAASFNRMTGQLALAIDGVSTENTVPDPSTQVTRDTLRVGGGHTDSHPFATQYSYPMTAAELEALTTP